MWKSNQKSSGDIYNAEMKSETSLEIRAPDPVSDQDVQNSAADAGPNVCHRFAAELNPCQPWFAVVDRATGRKVDIPESFAPSSCLAFLIKLLLGGLTLGTLVYTWIDEGEYAGFYLAYSAHWALLVSVFYFLLSITNTLLAAWTPQPPDTLPFCSRIRWTWILYEVAVHSEILVSIMYWVLVFEPGETVLNFQSVTPHCAIAVAVLIDGMFVNRIPVRLMHWYGFILPFDCLFIIWTVIHAYADVGNPWVNDNDPTTNDDVIYDYVNWKDEPVETSIIAIVVVFCIGPAVYLVLWWLSLYKVPCLCRSDRRIYTDTVDERDRSRPTVSDVEEGSLFATWK